MMQKKAHNIERSPVKMSIIDPWRNKWAPIKGTLSSKKTHKASQWGKQSQTME